MRVEKKNTTGGSRLAAHRSPKALIELYWTEVWNNRNAEMIRELCADPIIRHDPGSVTALSIDDQIARVRQQSERSEPYFEHEILHADDTYVTSVWNMHTRKGDRIELCGIEVFKAENGRFTHCWNSSYVAGRWGREGDKAVPDDLPAPGPIAGVEGVTPAWLQAVFQHAGLDAPRISMASSAPIGQGNLSATYRTQITYNANADKAVNSVVCKLTALSPQAVDIAGQYDVFGREVHVYEAFGDNPPLSAPRCFLAKAGADGRSLTLVLEDLTGRARPGDQIAGCSIAEARAVVAEFARLHCAYWKNPGIAGAPWLFDRAGKAPLTGQSYPLAAAAFRERFDGRIDGGMLDAMDRFVPLAGDMTAAVGPRLTLIHGEPRVDNVLFEDAADGPRAWLIDWQFADFGSPMFDTAYFLAGSLSPQDRRACERDLIAAHQAQIAKVDPGYSLDQALAEYAAALPFALFTTVGAVMAMPPSDHGDRLLQVLLERNVAALADWNAIP